MHICQTIYFEVKNIRKSLIAIMVVFLLFGALITPQRVNAADMNSSVGAVTTGGGNLYVRKKPSSGSTVLASLKKAAM